MSLETDIAVLGQVRPLSLLDRDALRLIAFSGDRRRLRAGDILFKKGDSTFGAAVVMTGQISLDGDEGDAHVVGPGALIGEMALLTPTQHAAQATARTDCEALVVSRHLFKRVLEEFPQSAVAIHQAYASELRTLSAQTARVQRRLDAIG